LRTRLHFGMRRQPVQRLLLRDALTHIAACLGGPIDLGKAIAFTRCATQHTGDALVDLLFRDLQMLLRRKTFQDER